MEPSIQEQLKEIRQSFRLMMSGDTSKSMRDKGVNYHINWGVPFIQLKEMAKQYGKNKPLAIELWKDNVRECKILATLIMPAEEMSEDLVDVWMEQTTTQEMIEMQAFNLYQYLPFASNLAFKWLADNRDLYQICAYQILARLFAKGMEPNERGVNELIDQAVVALQDDNIAVKHAAMTCLQRFATLNDTYERIVVANLQKLNLSL